MNSPADALIERTQWDPQLVARLVTMLCPVAKGWFRSQVTGLDSIPRGGALVVSNHSGGLFAMDAPVFAVDFFDTFGLRTAAVDSQPRHLVPRPDCGAVDARRIYPRQPRRCHRRAAGRGRDRSPPATPRLPRCPAAGGLIHGRSLRLRADKVRRGQLLMGNADYP